jgi:hypothetical protein
MTESVSPLVAQAEPQASPSMGEWLKEAERLKDSALERQTEYALNPCVWRMDAAQTADAQLSAHLRKRPGSDPVDSSSLSGEAVRAAASWVPVSERLPDDGAAVLVYTPPRNGEEERMSFDCRDDGVWFKHNDCHEHYMAVTGGKGCLDDGTPCTGPSEEAPYTHWMRVSPPSTADNEVAPPNEKNPVVWPKGGAAFVDAEGRFYDECGERIAQPVPPAQPAQRSIAKMPPEMTAAHVASLTELPKEPTT